MGFLGVYKDRTEKVLSMLLNRLEISVDNKIIGFCLKSHPFYPSMLSISDCLKEWKIDNDTYLISKEEYDPESFEYPLLAFLPDKEYIIIDSIADGDIVYAHADNNSAVMDEKSFLKVWDGVVLYANVEDYNHLSEKQPNIKPKAFISSGLILICTLLAAILAIIFYRQFPISLSLLSAIKLIGLGTTSLLIGQMITSGENWVKRFCNLKKKNECENVLNSSAAKITSWLSWTDIGFIYFAGSLIALLVSPVLLSYLLLLNVLSLPFTIWSIGFQYRNKSWCILCCLVQVLLWIEFVIFVAFFNNFQLEFDISLILLFLFCFLIPSAIWFFLKPIFFKIKKLESEEQELKKIKYNKEMFDQLLTLQPKFIVEDELLPIHLGSPEAKTIITIVSNPFCEPCARAHDIVEELLSYRDDLQFKILFATSANPDDPGVKIQKHITALSCSENKDLVRQALKTWYSNPKRDYKKWIIDHPVLNIPQNNVETVQKQWCTKADIQITPTILINGSQLPPHYTIEDIKYLVY